MTESEFWQIVERARKMREAAHREQNVSQETLAQMERRAFLMVAKAVEKREVPEPVPAR